MRVMVRSEGVWVTESEERSQTHTWSCGFLVPSVARGGESVNFNHTAHASTVPLSPFHRLQAYRMGSQG